MLTPAPTLRASDQTAGWFPDRNAELPLSNFRPTIENNAQGIAPPRPDWRSAKNSLLCLRLAGKPLGGTGHFKWLVDTATTRTITNVGTFNRIFWGRNSDQGEWVGDPPFNDVPNCIF